MTGGAFTLSVPIWSPFWSNRMTVTSLPATLSSFSVGVVERHLGEQVPDDGRAGDEARGGEPLRTAGLGVLRDGVHVLPTLHRSTFAYAFMVNFSVDTPGGMLWPTGNG
jgi:hypothetical protein